MQTFSTTAVNHAKRLSPEIKIKNNHQAPVSLWSPQCSQAVKIDAEHSRNLKHLQLINITSTFKDSGLEHDIY